MYYIENDTVTISEEDAEILGPYWYSEVLFIREDWKDLISFLAKTSKVTNYLNICVTKLPEVVAEKKSEPINIQNITQRLSEGEIKTISLIIKKRKYLDKERFLNKNEKYLFLSEIRDSSKNVLESNYSHKIKSVMYNHFYKEWSPSKWWGMLLNAHLFYNHPFGFWGSRIYPSLGFGLNIGISTLWGDVFLLDEVSILHYAYQKGEIDNFGWYKKDFLSSLNGAVVLKPHIPIGRRWRISPEFGIGFTSYMLSRDLFKFWGEREDFMSTSSFITFRYEKNLSQIEHMVYAPKGFFEILHGLGVTIRTNSIFRAIEDVAIAIDWKVGLSTLYFRENRSDKKSTSNIGGN